MPSSRSCGSCPCVERDYGGTLLRRTDAPRSTCEPPVSGGGFWYDGVVENGFTPQGDPLGGQAGLLSGRYRVGTKLGEGAMGVVYRGVDEQSGAAVAIKTLQPAAFHSPKARERFQREAGLANKLQHPGIAQILDFGVDHETPFLVMELIEGIELAEVIEKDAPLPPARAVDIALQLVSALAAAHHHNLIHRDIKPANIRMVSYSPQGPILLKVLDFGIAKEIGQEKGQLTTTGSIMGTPLYLAPELLSETHVEMDGRVDQYSVGVVLYQLLAGCPPFAGQTVASILLSHVTATPPPLPKTVPPALQRVVLRMLKKTAKERYCSDEELLAALSSCVEVCRSAQSAVRGATRPSSASLVVQLPTQSQGRQNVLMLLLAVVLLISTGMFILLIQRRSLERARVPPAVAAPLPTAQPAAGQSEQGKRTDTAPRQPPQSSVQVDRFPPQSPAVTTGSVSVSTSAAKPKPKGRPKPRPERKEDPFAVPLAR